MDLNKLLLNLIVFSDEDKLVNPLFRFILTALISVCLDVTGSFCQLKSCKKVYTPCPITWTPQMAIHLHHHRSITMQRG